MSMDKQEIKNRIEKVKKEINHHRYLYHVLDKHEISDAALDSLKNELFRLEMDNPEFITPDSPTQRVGGEPLDRFVKVQHSVQMISLFDAFSRDDIFAWEKRLKRIKSIPFEYFAELKLDGLAMSLRYEKDIFKIGATRGDGMVGEDVTQNLKTIESIPLELRVPNENELREIGLSGFQIKKVVQTIKNGTIEVRGEAIMNKTDFDFERHEQKLQLAHLLGFRVLRQIKFCRSLKEVFNFYEKWLQKRNELPFEIDGVVVKVNNLKLWPILGHVGKGPRFMMAYKFPAEQVTSKVEDVVWQVGRTGTLTPIAVLIPVRVGGVTVSHATLHNMDEIFRLGIKIGDTVILERAGDVIPKVIQVLPNLRTGREKEIQVPKKCHVCGGGIERLKNEVAYRCINKNCFAVTLRNLSHWTSRGAMDIEGLGPKIVEQLVKEGLVSDIADFYSLTAGDLKPLERFAEKSSENLIKAIANKKEIPLVKFIIGLGIRHVGEETALLLVKQFLIFNSQFSNNFQFPISQFLKYFLNLKKEDLENIPDIGPVVAESLFEWFRNEKNVEILNKLQKNGVALKVERKSKKQALEGKKFVLTGSLNSLTRNEAKAKIRELGGEMSSAVSSKTDYVIVGDNPGSKYDKAKKLGIEILNEDKFQKLITHNS